MSSMMTWARRLLWLVAIGAGTGLAVTWWRDRTAPPAPKHPPEWPPLTPDAPSDAAPSDAAAPDAAAPDAATPGAQWVPPVDERSCPPEYPVKANDNSGIYHVPGGRFYDRTKPERCYSTPDAAEADGYRRAKS